DALDRRDLADRTDAATYFDVNGTLALSYGRTTGRVLTGLAILLGAIAWIRLFLNARRLGALGRLLFTAIWLPIGFAVTVAMMIAATWALRVGRETFHPWYAYPDTLILLLAVVGGVSGW